MEILDFFLLWCMAIPLCLVLNALIDRLMGIPIRWGSNLVVAVVGSGVGMGLCIAWLVW